MDNQDATDGESPEKLIPEPRSLGEDILEQVKAREKADPSGGDEVWWHKYVNEPQPAPGEGIPDASIQREETPGGEIAVPSEPAGEVAPEEPVPKREEAIPVEAPAVEKTDKVGVMASFVPVPPASPAKDESEPPVEEKRADQFDEASSNWPGITGPVQGAPVEVSGILPLLARTEAPENREENDPAVESIRPVPGPSQVAEPRELALEEPDKPAPVPVGKGEIDLDDMLGLSDEGESHRRTGKRRGLDLSGVKGLGRKAGDFARRGRLLLEKVPSRKGRGPGGGEKSLPRERKRWLLVPGIVVACLAALLIPVLMSTILIPAAFVSRIVVEGRVEEQSQSLIASHSGKVETIFVDRWEKVQPGEPLAQLQSDQLDEEVASLVAKLKMRHEGLFQEHQEEIDRLNRSILKEEVDYVGLVSENETIGQQIGNLEGFLEREEGEGEASQEKKLGIAERLSELKADYARNESKIAKAKSEIAAAESDIRNLMEKVRTLQDREFLDLATLEEGVKYQKLLARREGLILKSSVKGTVSEIRINEGESVEEGESILDLVSEPDRIRILIPEGSVHEFSVGDPVWIEDTRRELFRVPITMMAPLIDKEYVEEGPGRRVFVAYPQNSELLPGQKVAVHLSDPERNVLQSFRSRISRTFQFAKRRE